MMNLLTSILGLVAKGPASKAIAGTIAGGLTALIGPEVLDAFRMAFQASGAIPAAELLGSAAGTVFLAGVNWLIVYASPANKPA